MSSKKIAGQEYNAAIWCKHHLKRIQKIRYVFFKFSILCLLPCFQVAAVIDTPSNIVWTFFNDFLTDELVTLLIDSNNSFGLHITSWSGNVENSCGKLGLLGWTDFESVWNGLFREFFHETIVSKKHAVCEQLMHCAGHMQRWSPQYPRLPGHMAGAQWTTAYPCVMIGMHCAGKPHRSGCEHTVPLVVTDGCVNCYTTVQTTGSTIKAGEEGYGSETLAIPRIELKHVWDCTQSILFRALSGMCPACLLQDSATCLG